MAEFFDYSTKGLVGCALKDKISGAIFVLPAPAGGSYDPGVELGAIEESNCEGETVNVKRFTTKRDSKLTVNFGAKLPEMIGIRLGKSLKRATTTVNDTDVTHFTVPTNGLVAAAAAGYAGFGVVANAASTAYFQNTDGFSEALIQDPDFGAFDPAAVGNEKKFAIGSNAALKIGSAAWGRRVTMEIPFPTSAFHSLDKDLISLSLRVIGVNIYLQQITWIFPDISIEPGAVDLKEPTQEMGFFVNGAYDIRFRQLFHICRSKVA